MPGRYGNEEDLADASINIARVTLRRIFDQWLRCVGDIDMIRDGDGDDGAAVARCWCGGWGAAVDGTLLLW